MPGHNCGIWQGTRTIRTASNISNDATTDPDAAAIARCQAGQPAAFGELVTRYQDRLFNMLVRVVGSADDAADLAQDAFVQAYQKLDSFRSDSQFYTWLYRIAINLAMSHRRRRRPHTAPNHDLADHLESPTDHHTSPDEQLMTRERIALVRCAIDRLADDHRAIVVLRDIEGCDYEQIATILDIPLGTVRSRLFRARLQLKEALGPLVTADE